MIFKSILKIILLDKVVETKKEKPENSFLLSKQVANRLLTKLDLL